MSLNGDVPFVAIFNVKFVATIGLSRWRSSGSSALTGMVPVIYRLLPQHTNYQSGSLKMFI